jgi:hypothetical protein
MKTLGRTEPVFLILTALIDEPRHGYAIVQEVRRITDGRVDLRIGTLYGALNRLTDDGLVQKHRDEIESGRLRRSSPVWPSALASAGLAALVDSLDFAFAWPVESPRNTFYVDLLVGSEFVLLCTAVASILFLLHRRRAALSREAA